EKRRFDVACLAICTSACDEINSTLRIKIDGEIFFIKVVEEPCYHEGSSSKGSVESAPLPLNSPDVVPTDSFVADSKQNSRSKKFNGAVAMSPAPVTVWALVQSKPLHQDVDNTAGINKGLQKSRGLTKRNTPFSKRSILDMNCPKCPCTIFFCIRSRGQRA
ncbi:hypothetical protein Ancab_019214, partial [Ancistrocladus abbreviatus]